MLEPRIEILPAKPAILSEGESWLDILVRITPPVPDVHFVRPPMNLGLVLDRSGSMSGSKKMIHAREAAAFAVSELLPTDRVSVTIFDNEVETIVPNTLAENKPAIIDRIRGIQPRHTTALHQGWREGADQVEAHFEAGGLNRVILLSDGLANEGITDPNVISAECKVRAGKGISTSTMGLGDDYNEDLMQKMGENGEGNYYFIETPQQLADIFHTELKGLMANVGSKVSLGIEPQSCTTVLEVLNEMDRNGFGRLMLPDLVVGMPIQVVIRLKVPQIGHEAEICRFRLAWNDPKTGDRLTVYAGLVMPAAPRSVWESLPTNIQVAEQVAFQMAARAKKEAVAAFDRGDLGSSLSFISQSLDNVTATGSNSFQTIQEIDNLREIAAHLEEGELARFRKKALWQSYNKTRGKE